jgi:hypothetical protein
VRSAVHSCVRTFTPPRSFDKPIPSLPACLSGPLLLMRGPALSWPVQQGPPRRMR